ncbi:MAG TPA: copper homeostasis protein CutC, partial [Pricia sp.]|nr:copper homeostasis protein CutC [Pricia sp.]
LDVQRTEALIHVSQTLKFTFHRAFDWVKKPINTLRQLEALGVDTVLTSGQRKSAHDGIDLLTELHQQAKTIQIMPGGGVGPTNILLFKENGFPAVHLSGSKWVRTLSTSPPIPMNTISSLKEDQISVTDPENIRKIVNAVV